MGGSRGLIIFSTLVVMLFVGLSTMAACSGEDGKAGEKKASKVKVDPCTLVTQTEAERLIGESLQPGKLDTTLPHLSSCIWAGANGPPKVILQ